MMVLKRRDFAKWQAGENLSDNALCNAVAEMENGLVDADLGGSFAECIRNGSEILGDGAKVFAVQFGVVRVVHFKLCYPASSL